MGIHQKTETENEVYLLKTEDNNLVLQIPTEVLNHH